MRCGTAAPSRWHVVAVKDTPRAPSSPPRDQTTPPGTCQVPGLIFRGICPKSRVWQSAKAEQNSPWCSQSGRNRPLSERGGPDPLINLREVCGSYPGLSLALCAFWGPVRKCVCANLPHELCPCAVQEHVLSFPLSLDGPLLAPRSNHFERLRYHRTCKWDITGYFRRKSPETLKSSTFVTLRRCEIMMHA